MSPSMVETDPRVPRASVSVLTRREVQVTAGVLHGWDGEASVKVLGCAVEKHIVHVSDPSSRLPCPLGGSALL